MLFAKADSGAMNERTDIVINQRLGKTDVSLLHSSWERRAKKLTRRGDRLLVMFVLGLSWENSRRR
jgi:hypothetical protein